MFIIKMDNNKYVKKYEHFTLNGFVGVSIDFTDKESEAIELTKSVASFIAKVLKNHNIKIIEKGGFKMKKMKTRKNSKEVKEKIREHIHGFYDFEDLVNDVEAFMRIYKTNAYSAGKKLVKHGNFLIYYENVREFLESLNLNNKSEKTFSDDDCWKIYTHLLAREISIIYKIKKGDF